MMRALIRLTCAIYCWLTAAYAFTSASSFTYQEVIRPRMFGSALFSDWHAVLYWPWLALLLFDLRGSFQNRGKVRLGAWAFAVTWTGVGAAITARPLLPGLTDDRVSLLVGACALLPLVWAAVLDHASAATYLRRQPASPDAVRRAPMEGRWLTAAMVTAGFITVVYAVLTPVAMSGAFEPDLLTTGLAVGLVWNAVDHAVIFSVAFLAIAVCTRIVAGRSFIAQYLAIAALLTATIALIVQRSVCDALGFEGWWSALVAVWSAVAIVSSWGALRLCTWIARDARLESPVDVFFGPAPAAGGHTPRAAAWHVVAFAMIALAAWGLAGLSRAIDWDFLLLKTGVIVLWFATASRVLRLTPNVRLPDGWLAVACVAPFAVHVVAGKAEQHAAQLTGDPTFSIRRLLDRYTIYNPAFRLADGVLSPPRSSSGQAAFMRFVRQNTDLGADVRPPSLDFVTPLPAALRPPHVFLFVVDSLRPDYLAPYNPAVTFTPRIAELAADSLVFRNAFTHYGGTGLSLPAIWMGGVGVHKQYVRPFWPMNTLEKLLNANRYQGVMGVDVIMEQLLKPVDPPVELDRGVRTMDYRMCRTLDELAARMPRPLGGAPVFGYSLPQDLHVSNIMTASVPPGESYPGFHAPYAARVRAIDRCVGAFVDFLKRHDLYDNSVVVLTSDHGEMLGEEGRWGHAYYLFPEILQVPLVIHLPAGARRDEALDPDAISFLTDISPTLYAALGYRPRPANRLMGEPLVGPDRVESATRRRGDYVAAASYSAVYAAIRRNGRRVYIVDSIKGDEYAYERDLTGAWRRADVTDGVRASGQRLIREHLEEIRRVYGVADRAAAGAARTAQR